GCRSCRSRRRVVPLERLYMHFNLLLLRVPSRYHEESPAWVPDSLIWLSVGITNFPKSSLRFLGSRSIPCPSQTPRFSSTTTTALITTTIIGGRKIGIGTAAQAETILIFDSSSTM